MKLAIGIDPSINTTGMAVWNVDQQKFTFMITLTPFQIWSLILDYKSAGHELFVILEDARKRKYFKGENMAAKAQGAGAVKGVCKMLEDLLKSAGISYQLKTPRNTKIEKEYWKKITEWEGRSSEHARDAAMLVCKINEPAFEKLKLMADLKR